MTFLTCLLCERGRPNANLVRYTAVSALPKFPGDFQRNRKSQGYNYLYLMKWQLCSALARSHLGRLQFSLAWGIDPFYPTPEVGPKVHGQFPPSCCGSATVQSVMQQSGREQKAWEGEASGPCQKPNPGVGFHKPSKALMKNTQCWKVGLKPYISLNMCVGRALTRIIHG